MILMIDNYDSFTYNFVQYLAELGATVEVFRNDELTLNDIEQMAPEKIVISPGPCRQMRREFQLMLSKHSPPIFPYWASAWVTRVLAKLLGEK